MHTPRLLVSVRSPREASSAIAGGADVIDVKEPTRGPMGMASPSTIVAVLEQVNAARPVSAALGEFHEGLAPPACASRLRYVKLGLAHAPRDWRRRLADHPALHVPERFVAVAYADHHRAAAPNVDDVLDWAIAHRVAGLLIDTAVKDGRGLLDWCSAPALDRWLAAGHEHGLVLALAGSLDADAIARLLQALPQHPGIVAVRGAACAGADRAAAVDASRVAHLKATLAGRNSASGLRAAPRAS